MQVHVPALHTLDAQGGASWVLVNCHIPSALQVWDLRSKRSVQTLLDSFQLLSVCFGDAGDTVYTAGIENVVKVRLADARATLHRHWERHA